MGMFVCLLPFLVFFSASVRCLQNFSIGKLAVVAQIVDQIDQAGFLVVHAYVMTKMERTKKLGKNYKKRTAAGIRWSSPTQLLIRRLLV